MVIYSYYNFGASGGAIDIIFPLVDRNRILDCDADWGQGVLHTAKHIANQEPYCAPSDHMISSKI